MIVVDANVIVYRHVNGPFTNMADKLVRIDPDWRTATIWRAEFTSALVKMIRAKVLTEPYALRAITAASAEMSRRDRQPLQQDVLHSALRDGISAYDAQYVALAETLGVQCVTSDEALARRSKESTVLLADFVQA